MAKFNSGDFVRITSGTGLQHAPPQMYVIEYAAGGVKCFWFSTTHERCEGCFPESLLERVGDPAIDQV